MSNTLDGGSFAQYWSRRMQLKLEKRDIFRALASWEGQSMLSDGDVYNKPYRSAVVTAGYTRGTAFTPQDLTNANDTLTVDQTRISPFYVDNLDKLQSKYPLINEYADDCATQLGNWLDADFLGEVTSRHADNTVDHGDHGGTDDDAFTLTTSNILKTFSVANRKLDKKNVPMEGRYMVISPEFHQLLVEFVGGKESNLGDSTGLNGHVGKYMGFNLYLSNNLTGYARLELGTLPTDGDTTVIEGVTFAWETGTRDTAGMVYAESDGPTSIDNLIAAIDLSGTSGTEYFPLTAANQGIADKWTMTDGSTYVTVKAEGAGHLVVSETLTAPSDIWTAKYQRQHVMGGRKGAVDMIVQKFPQINIRPVSDKLGVNIAPWILYGLATFTEKTKQLVDVMIRTDSY